MRLRHLRVKGLFNLFDHSVPLNLNERITIIHGANGLGKTALLRLVNAFFNSAYAELEAIPFSRFELDFDDGSQVAVQKGKEKTKNKGASARKGAGFLISRTTQSGKREEYYFESESAYVNEPSWRRLERELAAFVPGLERLSTGAWSYLPTGEVMSSLEVIARFQDMLPRFFRDFLGNAGARPEWLSKVRSSVNVHFIQTQRLVSYKEQSKWHGGRETSAITPAVQVYSQEITGAIKNTLAKYAELSQSLDRTFPERLMRQTRDQNLPSDELRDRLAALERKRQALEMTGLLEEERDVRFEMPSRVDSTTEKVLSVYVRDVESKLEVFKDIASKIDLLRKIIDGRFLYKKMTMHREKGFLFTSQDGHPLSPTELSSGEQNELVLLYELLFKVKPDSLILIDEPEISFHVAWQRQFLSDLQEIIRLSPFDVLIATHSPHVIHDRWDLTVELQGPPEGKR